MEEHDGEEGEHGGVVRRGCEAEVRGGGGAVLGDEHGCRGRHGGGGGGGGA